MNKYLNNIEYGTLSFFIINSFFINVGYNIFTSINNQDSIIDIIIGSTIIGLLLLIIQYIKSRNTNLLSIINSFKIIKYPLFIIILLISSTFTIYSLTLITQFIHYYILKDTNTFIISFTFTLTIIYLASKDLKTIAKTSNMLFYIYIILTILGYIGLIKYINIENLKPIMTSSNNSHIKTIFLFLSYSCYPLLMILSLNTEEKENKKELLYSILSLINIIIELIIIISTIGINLTNLYLYPNIAMYKKISFLNIIERVEIFLSFNQLLNSLFITVISIYLIKKLIITNIKIKKESALLTLLGIIFLFLTNTITISKDIYLLINYISLFIIILLFIRTLIYKYILNQ